MNVLILSQYYDPEPVPKAAELARELIARGHRVAVVTGFPHYPQGVLYPGYRLRLFRREIIDGVPIIRAFEYPYHGRSVVRRLINFFSFALAAPIAGMFVPRPDVMYVWHPPLTIGIAAWLIARLRRVPFVYDVQDLWPESAILSGLIRDGVVVRAMFALEKFVYRRASHILCVTEGARQNIMNKGVPAGKVTAMPHWVDESMLAPVPETARAAIRERFGWDGRFVAAFAGNLGLVQGLDTIVLAARELQESDGVRIVFIGDGTDKDRLVEMARRLGVTGRVQFIDRQPMPEMPPILAATDALLVHLRRSELSRYVIPTKTLAYLAAGKPVVLAMEGAAADLLRDSGAGIVVPPDDPPALAAALRRVASLPPEERARLGEKGRAYLEENLTKRRVIPRYEAILAAVARSQ